MLTDYIKLRVMSDYEVARLDQVHALMTDEEFEAIASVETAARNVRVLVAHEGTRQARHVGAEVRM